jgi:hypothetical protein
VVLVVQDLLMIGSFVITYLDSAGETHRFELRASSAEAARKIFLSGYAPGSVTVLSVEEV